VSVQDFVFAKEVKLGTYKARPSSIPPAALIAQRAMAADPRCPWKQHAHLETVAHESSGRLACERMLGSLACSALSQGGAKPAAWRNYRRAHGGKAGHILPDTGTRQSD
jgi:hypothetical protein